MDYKVIGTGSKGNCVRIGNVMVDCGLSYTKIKEELYDVNVLLLTHAHSDHVNRKTLALICEWFPHIEIFANYEVFQLNSELPIRVINANYPFISNGYTFTPFECIHDVLTYGYTWEVDGRKIIYATDTSSMENAPEGKYDYFFIESNHCEKKLELAMNQVKGSYNPYISGKRHLSTQQAKTFYFLNRRNKDAAFIELHQSSRFY